MSLFHLFKKKPKTTVTKKASPIEDEAITWENTTDPDVFFKGYHQAIADLENNEQVAAAETLRANAPALQKAFIDRFETATTQQISAITDIDQRTEAIITAIKAIRVYNKEMTIDVRAHLAQTKKNLIGE